MSSPRIIRPVGGDRIRGSAAVELNLEDVRELGRQMVREARQRVCELEESRRAIEEEIRARREIDEQAAAARRQALEAELDSARAASVESLEQARQQALESARDQGLELGRRQGWEEGYAEGRQSGYREGREAEIERLGRETAPVVAALRALIDEYAARRRELLDGARAGVIRFAVEVARRVVKREVRDFGDAIVTENVRRALDLVFLRNRIVVQVNHEDLVAIERFAAGVLASFSELEDFEIRPAREVERGGCRILAGTGVVDLSLDVQLDAIENALLGDLAGAARRGAATGGNGAGGVESPPAAVEEAAR